MLKYFFKRLLHGIPVLIVVATFTFIIMRMVPGGPFDEEKKLPPEILANIQAKYHLDQPVITQYLLYLKQLVQGDMGPSYKYIGRDVTDIISATFPNLSNKAKAPTTVCNSRLGFDRKFNITDLTLL